MTDLLIVLLIAAGAFVFTFKKTAVRIAVLMAVNTAVFILLIIKGVSEKTAFVYAVSAFFIDLSMPVKAASPGRVEISGPWEAAIIILNLFLFCFAAFRIKAASSAGPPVQAPAEGAAAALTLAFCALMSALYFAIKKSAKK
jgi:hypothetical protein